jgi:hypothetical protein
MTACPCHTRKRPGILLAVMGFDCSLFCILRRCIIPKYVRYPVTIHGLCLFWPVVFFSTVLSCSLFVESGVHPPLCSSSSTLGVYAESMVGLLISVVAVPIDWSTWFVGHYI